METTPLGTANADSPPRPERWWTLPVVLVAALGVVAALLVTRRDPRGARPGQGQRQSTPHESPGWTPPLSPEADWVALEIDFGNGARRVFSQLPWRPGMTVGDVMRQARQFEPGLAFTSRGEGREALLTSIDGVAGGAADGRFWLYDLNDRPGDVSFEVQPVAAGDRVLWSFKGPE